MVEIVCRETSAPVDLGEVDLDLTGRQALHGKRDDHLVDPGQAFLSLAYRIRAFVPECGNQLPELTRAQPGERGCPGELRRRGHTRHSKIISLLIRSPGLAPRPSHLPPEGDTRVDSLTQTA